ncbi:unnamed protein product [Chilo suppressalis]|uniref:RRM domain-containing protein n=1 Tax=Chilo suppressalis TaxID=168631 RepID=A0ABN8AP23_CHISP|nr:unnamed protein product [Chilo suppressalis]
MKESLEDEANSKYKDGVNRNARLIVRNIPFKATEDSLREHFARYGTVEEVKLLRKPDGKLVGCGFVHFTHVPMANEALAATNKKPFLDRPLNVAWAVPKHKYGEKEQKEDPARNFKKGVSSYAVKIKEEDQAEDEVSKQKGKAKLNRNARLVVRNVSFKASEESLKEHFQSYGEIIEVKLLKKPDGKLVGCAFIHFKNVPMAKKALLNTNMKPFLGRPISVDWAVPKNKYMQHIVHQQLEMENEVKKEDSDSDEDGPPLDISADDLKEEVKSESDDDSSDDDNSDGDDKKIVKSDSDENSEGGDSGSDDDDEDEDEVDEDEDGVNDDAQSEASTQAERKRTKLNDAEDGLTVFLSNVPFSVDDHQLRQFVERVAPVSYALVCVDRLTEHSKGSGFVKFTNKEDAEKFLSLPADQLKLDGQVIQVKPALNRESLQKSNKKEPKDNRNLYLVKEGVIVAGTKAAEGVSASDMSKRLALERSKTQMLKNLNRFVSRYRLVVSNLPATYDDTRLRRLCARSATVTECRIMRDLRAPVQTDGKHPSKGYGFVMFTKHEDALACLRRLNNNPEIFDKNNRPIVSFSIEDRTALNARKKRLEKSIANNPTAQNGNNANNEGYNNRKRKGQSQPDESYLKKKRFDKDQGKNWESHNNQGKKWESHNSQGNKWESHNSQGNKWQSHNSQGNKWESHNNQGRNAGNKWENKNKKWQNKSTDEAVGKYVRLPKIEDDNEYTGLTAKEGTQHKMRSNHKLRTQADLHRQHVKMEKKKSKNALRLKKASRERVKQPKQKINKNPGSKNKRRKFKPNNIKDILK